MPNQLIHEQSPYLLQHAHNPVNWLPWSDGAFEQARRERKPVIVSIGYAACHWCHVMERESFEDPETAAYMNEHFVCIKVDREEHPDVDHMYMDAVQAISGTGGWPLNVFATSERIPFYGGTYYPPRPAYNRASWMQVLQQMHDIWVNRQEDVRLQTEQMIQYLRQIAQAGTADSASGWDMDTCRSMAEVLLKQADTLHGGFGRAPKFPGTMAISFLLEHYQFTQHTASLDHALLSLDKMIDGGIYDQLGGGLARYATDDTWLAPHFEKMLYDNALLVWSLCDAYSITRKERYREVIEEILAFAEREMKNPAGGYYSALDADSEGAEGLFYTWSWEEWTGALGENDEAVARYFGVTESGNWEGRNILHVAAPVDVVAAAYGISAEALEQRVKKVKEQLWLQREKRIRPLTDDKVLLSWNALFNLALTRAAIVLDKDEYMQRATAHMQWMTGNFRTKDGLMHTWKGGVARIMANLDDYAYLIRAMIQLGAHSGEEEWLHIAGDLMKETNTHFRDEAGVFYFYTSGLQTDIPVRKTDLYDHALPAANAMQAGNLLLLSLCMEETEWQAQAMEMMGRMAGTAARYTVSFSYWATLLQRVAHGIKLVAMTGEKASQHRRELAAHYLPHLFILTSKKEISDLPVLQKKYFPGESPIFVCSLQACYAPVSDVQTALPLLGL